MFDGADWAIIKGRQEGHGFFALSVTLSCFIVCEVIKHSE